MDLILQLITTHGGLIKDVIDNNDAEWRISPRAAEQVPNIIMISNKGTKFHPFSLIEQFHRT
jgi:hypothetical protein